MDPRVKPEGDNQGEDVGRDTLEIRVHPCQSSSPQSLPIDSS